MFGKRAIFTTLLLAGTFGAAIPAQAELGGGFSANISMLNDYRFRGVSLNDEGFALQGGIDWSHDSGFYVGTWASNISYFKGATIEQDIYGGYSSEINGISYDIGGLLYHYPGGTNTDYFEAYGSVGIDLGFVSAKVGSNYAFSNSNLGNNDNIYIYTEGDFLIPETPLSVKLHLGYEDGSLADQKWNWSIGTSMIYKGLDFGVSYIDTNKPGDNFDAAVVFSVGASF